MDYYHSPGHFSVQNVIERGEKAVRRTRAKRGGRGTVYIADDILKTSLRTSVITSNLAWAFFLTISHVGGGSLHLNFVVVAPMIMKFGTAIKLDVFYIMAAKCL